MVHSHTIKYKFFQVLILKKLKKEHIVSLCWLRWEGSWFVASLGKKLVRPHLNQELGSVMCACHPKIGWRLRLGGS
jgi:hypothetical protein